MNTDIQVGFIGYGRLAKHLVPAIQAADIEINQWYVRNESFHDEIRNLFRVDPVSHITELNEDSDLIIMMVSDHAIDDISQALNLEHTLICHTSGMTSVNAIAQTERGIFYPLNTFSGLDHSWNCETPIFIQATNHEAYTLLRQLAKKISSNVQLLDESTMPIIHTAAVVSQNFSNHLIAQAETLLESHGQNRKVILPLLESMISNLKLNPARSNQTGPAIRRDQETIEKQIDLLQKNKSLLYIYKSLTRSIQSEDFN